MRMKASHCSALQPVIASSSWRTVPYRRVRNSSSSGVASRSRMSGNSLVIKLTPPCCSQADAIEEGFVFDAALVAPDRHQKDAERAELRVLQLINPLRERRVERRAEKGRELFLPRRALVIYNLYQFQFKRLAVGNRHQKFAVEIGKQRLAREVLCRLHL